jgi:hypothetical protein
MTVRGSLRWIALALLGLVIAAAVALAASNLASQQIGIASESVSAGDLLAPPVNSVRRQQKEDHGGPGTEQPTETNEPDKSNEPGETTTESEAETTAPPTTSGEDDGGGGGGEGGDD